MIKKYSISTVIFLFSVFFVAGNHLVAQEISKRALADTLTAIALQYANIGKVSVKSMKTQNDVFHITTNDNLSYMPFRPENVQELKERVRNAFFGETSTITVEIITDGKHIEELIPNAYLPKDQRQNLYKLPKQTPLITNNSLPYSISKGLQDKHIALWGSHGYYFEQTLNRWEWQRARLLGTVEDLYTSSYVQPFLVPMLENAGACVLQPRERDTQTHEIIVDNDEKGENGRFVVENRAKKWKRSENDGFRNAKQTYTEGENPFKMGTYRYSKAEIDSNEMSCLSWIPAIPESGEYAVYIAYKSVPQSVTDAHYTVNHSGGSTQFSVNQKMGGGTWIYLGTFHFDKGTHEKNSVTLCNISKDKQGIVTADAVKFGGGMGNIARKPQIQSNKDTAETKETSVEGEISGYPRFREGARYWLQWAGIPDSVYNYTKGTNDYIDDYSCRGRWVNYLAGGSPANPNESGLKIPIHLGLAFHTDAGLTPSDSIVGTLLIFTSKNNDKKTNFPTGISRYNTRDLADIMQTQIVEDVRSNFAPEWERRAIFNKSYSETRNPEVPTVILELLSHQNFADMRYGQDPRFKFCVSRAIYKAILKYIHLQYGTTYVVQPLPVNRFALAFQGNDSIKLSWKETIDSLENSACPTYYIVYTKIDDGGYDNGIRINTDSCLLPIEANKHYCFRIVAGNKGGISLPSETLSAFRASHEKGKVLIINDFDRLSAPESFSFDSTYAGFIPNKYGVPYGYDFSYVGQQYEFRRDVPWADDDAPGFGASYANYEQKLVAGNTFDYPLVHGKAIAQAGYSYVSTSVAAIDITKIDSTYFFVDVIAGKQKQTQQGTVLKRIDFQTFPKNLQTALTHYAHQGGNILVSGAYIGTDIWEEQLSTEADRQFAKEVLHYSFRTNCASQSGKIRTVSNSAKILDTKRTFSYFNEPNSIRYMTEEPDGIEPAGEHTCTILRYTDNNLSAAIAHNGLWKTCIFGFPLECLEKETDLKMIMQEIIDFYTKK